MLTPLNVLTHPNRREFTNDARHIRMRGGIQRIQDTLSFRDRQDIYTFSLQKSKSFRAKLSKLDHNATLVLYDGDKVRIATSNRPSTQKEKIQEQLDKGTYFLQVKGRGRNPDTRYQLRLKTSNLEDGKGSSDGFTPIGVPTDNAGNSQARARDLGMLDGIQTYQDWVGRRDTVDYYQFSVGDRSVFSLDLTHLTADADVMLMDASGTVLQESMNTNNQDEFITQTLPEGRYFVRVSRFRGNTFYSLTLNAKTAMTPPTQFSASRGYGLVNAANAVSQSLGQPDFPEVADSAPTWGVDRIQAPEVWNQGFTGKDVVVAVIDSGVDFKHRDLARNIWRNPNEIPGNGIDDDRNGYVDDLRGWDFIGNDGRPMDKNGHGTHVAGTIAAQQNSIGVTGVAPDAKIMPIRALDDQGAGSSLDIARGVRYAVDNGADVINLSLGGDFLPAEIGTALRYAADNDVITVMAAGNESEKQPSYPARFANLWGIAVGASDRTNDLAWFSNQAGQAPLNYVVAPGVDIRSTLPNNQYAVFQGTSMAAPHVAGVVALMLDANPNLPPEAIENLLVNSTTL